MWGKEAIGINQARPLWFIDLDWFQQHNRSFSALAQSYLCSKRRERLTGETSATNLLATMKDCCAKTSGFITEEVPILESIFRLFLTHGNQPLDLKELRRQLSDWCGGDSYRTSVEILSRLLKNEQYYGLRQAQD